MADERFNFRDNPRFHRAPREVKTEKLDPRFRKMLTAKAFREEERIDKHGNKNAKRGRAQRQLPVGAKRRKIGLGAAAPVAHPAEIGMEMRGHVVGSGGQRGLHPLDHGPRRLCLVLRCHHPCPMRRPVAASNRWQIPAGMRVCTIWSISAR